MRQSDCTGSASEVPVGSGQSVVVEGTASKASAVMVTIETGHSRSLRNIATRRPRDAVLSSHFVTPPTAKR